MASCRFGQIMCAVVAAGIFAVGSVASAQSASFGSSVHQDPRAETLRRMSKPITIELTDQRLENVMKFIEEVSGAPLSVQWLDDANADGLDPELQISVSVKNVTMLALLERVLERAQADAFSANTWQLTRTGVMEVGPKSRLNKHRRAVLYPVDDLLFVIPSFTEAPTLDLDSILNQRRGGSSGSIFEDDDQSFQANDPEAKAQELIDLLVELIESDQWENNGGDAASIRFYNGALLINAPDYIHRQIDGYSFWPQVDVQTYRSGATSRSNQKGAAGSGAQATGASGSAQPPTSPDRSGSQH